MSINSENLRMIMGFKLKQFRLDKGFSLKELAEKTNLSISYLSEIEKGKKYPKPEKILQLAEALGVSFDDLVSLQMNQDFDPLPVVFSSPVIKEFPFRMYGVSPQDLLSLITGDPEKSGALIRTFLDIGQDYNMRVEHLLLAALRSYQQMHLNYFEEIETAAAEFANVFAIDVRPPDCIQPFEDLLKQKYGYIIDDETLATKPELNDLRAVWVNSQPPKLLLQKYLLPAQRAFVLCRELGFQYLKLKERPNTSARLMASFEPLLNNFKASYFSSAVMMNRQRLLDDMKTFLGMPRWDGNSFIQLIDKYSVTPEMFLYRLSALMPRFLNLRDLIFVRFQHAIGSEQFEMTRIFNMSKLFIPNGIGAKENYCRRWMSIKLLQQLVKWPDSSDSKPLIAAQRLHFLNMDSELFSISLAYRSPIVKDRLISVTVSFVINDNFKQKVKFWDDPQIPRVDVNETCERCGLTAKQCNERAVPGTLYERQQEVCRQESALSELLKNIR